MIKLAPKLTKTSTSDFILPTSQNVVYKLQFQIVFWIPNHIKPAEINYTFKNLSVPQ